MFYEGYSICLNKCFSGHGLTLAVAAVTAELYHPAFAARDPIEPPF